MRPHAPRLIMVAAAVTLLAGCTAVASPSANPPAPPTSAPTPSAPVAPTPSTPRTLHIAHIDGSGGLDQATEWFAEALARRSDGRLTATFDFGCCGADADVEQQLIDKVAAGDADLGWVGVRAINAAGSPAFDPLITPLLFRSYDAMEKVLADDDVTSPMLGSLKPLGVVGLGVVPGSMRYPISTDEPLTDPAEWAHLPFYSFESTISFKALRALGVKPVHLGFKARDKGFEAGTIKGLDNSLVYQAERADTLRYVVPNVPLWARISTLIASPKLRLSDDERTWVRQAVADTVARTPDLADVDRDAIIGGCDAGSKYANATAAQFADFADRLAPVQQSIAAASRNAQTLAAIHALVDDMPVPRPLDCRSARAAPKPSADPGAGALDGTFRTIHWTRRSLLAHGAVESFPGELSDWNTDFTVTFDDGAFTWIYDDPNNGKGVDTCTGTYAVNGDRVRLTVHTAPVCGSGSGFFEAGFALIHGGLRFFDISTNPLDAIFFGTEPLTRIR